MNTQMNAQFTSTPAAKSDLLDEITEQDYVTANGGFFGLSRKLGNRGRICTLTKECQSMCN
ncbi:plantaricin C family lantibiotic [Actinomyces procaprae]|uniref:plantaricin C family lantibiotic n=1 Tax=Actinomyces procaprae TaxID=2560010 RepID=UPI001B3516FA|nr:plantaricin C family lantibiotic [Actinomyces procaprae]